MWDYKSTGPGSNLDHSAMAVHEPQSHHTIDWHKKQDPIGPGAQEAKRNWKNQAPWWWKQTEEARRQVAEEFDQTVNVAKNQIPWQVEAHPRSASIKIAAQGLRPWVYIRGKTFMGNPGQTYAQLLADNGIHAHTIWSEDHQVGRYDPTTGKGEEPPNFERSAAA